MGSQRRQTDAHLLPHRVRRRLVALKVGHQRAAAHLHAQAGDAAQKAFVGHLSAQPAFQTAFAQPRLPELEFFRAQIQPQLLAVRELTRSLDVKGRAPACHLDHAALQGHGVQAVGGAHEFGHERGGRAAVDVFGCAELGHPALLHHDHPV